MPVRRGRAARGAVRARRAGRRARGRAGGRLRPRAAAAPRPRSLRAVHGRRGGAAAGARLTRRACRSAGCGPTRCCRSARTRATRASTSRRASASCSSPASARLVGTGVAVAIPRRLRGLRPAALGPRRSKHGITIVNTPGLVDSGYRGELRIILLNTDREHAFEVEPGMRIAQLVLLPVPRGRAARRRRAARLGARRARLRLVAPRRWREPRIRVSALLGWREQILLCRHEKPGKEYWLLPGRRRRRGGEPHRRAAPRARGGARDRRGGPGRGPGVHRRLDRAEAHAARRSTSCTSSSPATSPAARSTPCAPRTPPSAATASSRSTSSTRSSCTRRSSASCAAGGPGDPVAYLGSLWVAVERRFVAQPASAAVRLGARAGA